MTTSDFNGVANTSLLTAAMRAVETNRTDAEGRLFSDPYAETLAGEFGKQLLSKAIETSGDQPAIAIRTAFMDSKFRESVENGCRQIVALASGMDTRAYRIQLSKEVRFFELDQPAVLKYKRDKLQHAQPQCELHDLPVDLRDDWPQKLLAAGFKRSEKTLWVVEGLLMYLSEPQVLSLFERINSLATSGDIVLFDILSRTLLDMPHMKTQLEFLSSLGAPWDFGTNDPVGFMHGLGWTATLSQPGDFAPHRWPFPTAPLNVPNIPRGYYVHATRD